MHFAISLDDFCGQAWSHLEYNQDGGSGHYARFTADSKEAAACKAAESLKALVLAMMYESDEAGYPLQ